MRTILEPRGLLGEIGGIRTVFSNPSFYIRCILGGKRPRDWWYKVSYFEAGFWEVLKVLGALWDQSVWQEGFLEDISLRGMNPVLHLWCCLRKQHYDPCNGRNNFMYALLVSESSGSSPATRHSCPIHTFRAHFYVNTRRGSNFVLSRAICILTRTKSSRENNASKR